MTTSVSDRWKELEKLGKFSSGCGYTALHGKLLSDVWYGFVGATLLYSGENINKSNNILTVVGSTLFMNLIKEPLSDCIILANLNPWSFNYGFIISRPYNIRSGVTRCLAFNFHWGSLSNIHINGQQQKTGFGWNWNKRQEWFLIDTILNKWKCQPIFVFVRIFPCMITNFLLAQMMRELCTCMPHLLISLSYHTIFFKFLMLSTFSLFTWLVPLIHQFIIMYFILTFMVIF